MSTTIIVVAMLFRRLASMHRDYAGIAAWCAVSCRQSSSPTLIGIRASIRCCPGFLSAARNCSLWEKKQEHKHHGYYRPEKYRDDNQPHHLRSHSNRRQRRAQPTARGLIPFGTYTTRINTSPKSCQPSVCGFVGSNSCSSVKFGLENKTLVTSSIFRRVSRWFFKSIRAAALESADPIGKSPGLGLLISFRSVLGIA
jgi:hypothetical protein